MDGGKLARSEDERPAISVCMAAFNGQEFIKEQLSSILLQIGPQDEVVIVDDHSTDGTVAEIMAVKDPRIRLLISEKNSGYTRAFERALRSARGAVIFLSDQDDIWPEGRVDLMLHALSSSALVVGNCTHFGGIPGSFQRIRLRSVDSTHRLRNLMGIIVGYRLHWGSAMAFRASLLQLVLPFPKGLTESHDQWIAMVANVAGSVTYLDDDVLLHRLHQTNVTPKQPRSISRILGARFQFIRELRIAVCRVIRRGSPR